MLQEKGSVGKGFLFLIAVVVIAVLFIFSTRDNSSFFSQGMPASVLADVNIGKITTGLFPQAQAVDSVSTAGIETYFCPQDNCAEHLIQKIDSAESSIYVAIYSFTLDNIGDALVRAEKRGVEVRVVFDYDQSSNAYSEDEKLAAAGVGVAMRNGVGYMHNKFSVIDEEIVATGSFNYSANADEKNDENLIFIDSNSVAQKYKEDFDKLWEISRKVS